MVSAPPDHHFWHCLHVFTVTPNPLHNSPTLLHIPALPSGTLGKSTTLPAHPKNRITDPKHPRLHGRTLFFTFFWVVGNYLYAYMK